MANEQEDVEATETPSPSADATDSQDVEQVESSTTETHATETEPSLSDVVAEAARESLAREASAESEATQTEEEATQEKSGEETEAALDKTKETTEAAKADADVPKEFAKHPAWQRIMRERDEARTEAAKTKELAKAQDSLYDYCRQNHITEQQFKEGLNIISLVNTNPEKAYELLQPTIQQLEAHLGVRLPEDIQKKVSEGLLDPETGKELARLRAEKAFGKNSAQATEAQRAQANVRAMAEGLNEWDKNKTTADADFEKKRSEVMERYLYLLNEVDARGQKINLTRTPQEAVALAERALADVNTRWTARAPKPAPRKAPISHRNASGSNGKVEIKTTKDAVSAMLAEKHGITLD